MKERLSAVLAVGIIFSLFFYYKVINPVENNMNISSINQNKEILEFEIIEDENINIIDEIAIDEKNENHCSLDLENTDSMDFSSAFKYYRECNGSSSTFSWNNNLYSTILSSEVTPDNNNQANNENLIVDKKHLNLQNAIIGDNSNIE